MISTFPPGLYIEIKELFPLTLATIVKKALQEGRRKKKMKFKKKHFQMEIAE